MGAAALGLTGDAAAPVLVAEALAGEQDLSLVAMAGDAVPRVMLTMRGDVATARIGAEIGTGVDGIPLPEGAARWA